ncbi:MAG: DinB family protein [Terracidiphilus sp.]
MEDAQPQSQGFRTEFLHELAIPQTQLLALAEDVPAESYGWRPATDARSFSEVLVHVAAGNFMLLHRAGLPLRGEIQPPEPVSGDPNLQWLAIVHQCLALEKSLTEKPCILELLRSSFEVVRQSFGTLSEEQLDAQSVFFGQTTTIRRFYLRILAHANEHMGQLIAYLRAMGIHAPWPDPVREMERRLQAT